MLEPTQNQENSFDATKETSQWERGFDKTKFAKGGGCCFECCDYEGMYIELKDFIHKLLQEEIKKWEEDNNELISVQGEYIKLLEGECGNFSIMASTHGMGSSQKDIDKGEKLRQKIEELKRK